MSNLWVIKDAEGNVTNACIKADEEFVAATYDHYEAFVPREVPALTAEEEARMWRDQELSGTDIASQTPDWPNRDNIIIYRAALRAWPASSDFPATRPVLGV